MTRSPTLVERLRDETEYQRRDKGVDAAVIAIADKFPLVSLDLVRTFLGLPPPENEDRK